MKTITRYLARRITLSWSRYSNHALNINLQVGVLAMILILLFAIRLVTSRQDAYFMQQADNPTQPYPLIQSHARGKSEPFVLKFYNSNTTIKIEDIQGKLINGCTNRRGDAAFSVEADNRVRSYLVVNGKCTAIRIPGARDVRVRKINERGDVIGIIARPDRQWSRSVWRAYVLSRGRLFELDTFGGPNCFVNDINEEGVAVGKADTAAGSHHAFQWQAGVPMQDLGTLPRGTNSEAIAINEKREIVGSGDVDGEVRHALLWRSGVTLDLNRKTLLRNGWELQEGCAINAQGEIMVFGVKDHLSGYFWLKAQSGLASPAGEL